MKLILRKEKYILGRIGLKNEILGAAELILVNWGARAKYFQGAENFFQGFGEIGALVF